MGTYETDFYAWTRQQAAALRDRKWTTLDVDHLAEEIESVGQRDRDAIESQLVRVLLHLLKLTDDPVTRPRWPPVGRWHASPRPVRGRWRRCWMTTSGRRPHPCPIVVSSRMCYVPFGMELCLQTPDVSA